MGEELVVGVLETAGEHWPRVGLVEPIRGSAALARPARPEPRKNVVMSVRRDEMPSVSARSRFCTTARMRRPIGVNFIAAIRITTHTTASARMNSRVLGTTVVVVRGSEE